MRGVATSPCGCGVRRCRRAPCALGVLARVAVSLLVAVLAGAGLAVSASADVPAARGEVTGLEVASEASGELTLRWTPPADPVGGPSEYRISWAPEGEDFRTWTDLDWNAFEAAPLSEYTVTGLDREVAYKVRMRARYHAGTWASDPWSGPWAETDPVLASPDDVPQDDVPQDDVPQDDVPQDDVPQDDVPQDDVPQDDVPQDDVPAARGEVTGVGVISEAAGELTLRWTPPADPVGGPSEYRISWAPEGEDFRTWTDLDWNVFEAAPLSEYTITGLDPGVAYKVRMRARYHAWIWASDPWSGPWAETDPVLASPDGVPQDDVPQDDGQQDDGQQDDGEVTGLEVASGAAGELTLRWTPPADPVGGPSEYRISWAPEGEDFRTWTDLDWNVFEAAPLSEYTITGLDPGVAYKVRMRARYHAWIWASDPWSGPWVETDPVLAAPVEDEEQQEEDEGGEDGLPGHEQVALELDPPTPPLYDTLDPELNELVARSLASEFDDDGSNGTRSPGSDGSESKRVLVWTKPSAVKSVLGFLRNSGAAVRDPLEGDNVLVADVAVSLLPRLAGQQGVLRVQLEPELVARGDDGARVHGALNWQGASFGGAGTRIAIVDIAFGDYDATKIENSVLPRPAAIRCYTSVTQIVTTLAACGLSDSRDHGTVVTEFAYETAPDAEFYLLKVYSDSDVHASIPWLVENRIDVVNISFGCECWFGYGDGSTNKTTGAIAVFDELVEQGIAVSLAGGNDANKTWFGTGFNDPDADGWLDWVDGDECNTVALDEGTTYSVIARWDDVWGGSSKDLDVYLANSAGSEVVASSTYRQIGRSTDDAYEQINFRPETTGDFCAAVKRNGDVSVGWVQVAFLGGVSSVERTSGSHELVGPSDTKNPGVLMVGALDNRVSGNMTLVSFSSRGPMPDGTIKPDIVGSGVIHSDARDGTVSGTSMAAPHVAGLMALVLQRHPWFTPQQIASHLKDNALPRPNAASSPNNEWGHGLAFLPGEPASGSAVIAGLPEVGATLRASLSGHSEPDSPAGANSYRWLRVRDGATEEIAQATSASYTAAAADVGAQLRVRVRYTDHVDYVEEFLSDSTEVVQPQPDVFASSLAQSVTSTEVDLVAGGRVAQRFGTGAQGSFALERIELQTAVALSAGSAYTVKLHAADPDKTNEPGTAVVTLEGTLEAVGTRVFTPQSPTELDAGSQYWVVVEVTSVAGSPSSQGRLAYKTGTSGLTLATGWALPASSLRRSQGETGWTTVSERVGLAVKGYVSASAPTFSATRYPGGAVVRTVDENTSSGNVGAAVTATDPNNRTLAYSVAATGDSDAAAHLAAFGHHFELDAATGQVSVRAAAAIDYETRASYKVKYQVTDSVDSAGSVDTAIDDTITLTVDVVNIDEPATVTLTGATSPAVGTELTASVADPDGIVSGTTTAYQWSRSARPDTGFADITDADAASYTPVAADTDMFLRAKATYTDFHGVGRTAHGVTSSAVGVTAAPLVQNFENLSGSAGYTPPTGEEIFQGFTTGDNPAGYLLSEIRVQLPLADTAARAEIWSSSRNSDGVDLPDERLVDLVSPATRTAGVKASFTAPAGVVLAPGTTYFVMFAGTTGVFVAPSTDEDSGSSPGWSIGDKFLVQGAADNPGVFRQFSSRAGIAVHGAVVLGPPGPLSDVAVTPGAGEVTVTWSAPVIHGRRAVTKYEVRHRVASEPEWAYGAWSDVADSADAGTDLHDERSVTVTGLAGGTAYTFEVRAVNSRGGGTGAEASATPAVSVDRPGVVSFSAGLAVGTALTASLADLDTVSGTPTWQWARSATPDPGFVDITDADAGSYTPVEDDRAYFLRATVSYTDGHGAGKSASAVTALPVGVTARVLAKNTDQRSAGSQAYSNALVVLTAGSSPGGYGLSRVGIEFVSGTVTSPGAVEIKEYDNDQTAGDTLAVLVPPESLQAGAVNYFTVPAPAGLRLSGKFMLSLADTTSIQLAARLGSVVDDGHADGWNIATAFHHSTGLALVRPRIVVEGFELLGRPGPPLSVAASAGTGEVMLSWSAPDSDGHRPVTKYQVRHRRDGGFFLETGDWSDVADSDGDSELDDERSLTVSGLAGGTEHVFQVRAVNSLGDGAEVQVKATPRSHTAPMFAAVDYPGGAASRSVAENAMSGDVGLPIIASDADGDSLTYSVAATGDSDAAAHLADFNRDFELDTASGQVSVKAGASIDFEDRSSYVVSYRVTDGEDAAGTAEGTPVIDDTVTLTVSVTNVDEAGAVTLSGTAQVGEVLTASVSDPDGSVSGEVWQWSKASTMSGSFTDISGAMSASYTVLAADEGEFLKAAATYDDGFGAGRSASATSAVVAAAVVAPSVPVFGLGAGTVQVDSLAETLDGFTDFGGSAFAQSFATGGSASDSFVVRGVRVALAVGSGASVGVSVWTSDSQFSTGVPDAMVGGLGLVGSLDGDRSTVEEFVSASGVVLAGDTTYWLVFSNTGNEDGSVQVPYLEPTGSFRDADTLWSLYVDVVFDEGKEGDESDWVDDGEGRPLALAIVGDPQRSVAENSTAGTVGALVVASDADGDSLTYSVAATSETDGAAHLTAFDRDFLLDASSGQVSVKSGAAIDYEDRHEYRVLYRVTDGEDLSGAAEGAATIDDEVTLTIRVTNVDEPGAVTFNRMAQADQVLRARVSDPDGSVSDDVWVWSKSQTRSGTFTVIAGVDSDRYTPTADDVGMFLQAAATYDDGSGSDRTASAVTAEAVAAAAAVVTVTARELLGNVEQQQRSFWRATTDIGQVFTTGHRLSGYMVTGAAIVSDDPQGDAFDAQICEVDNLGLPTSVCTDLDAPQSFAAGTIVFTAPTSPALTLEANTSYALVARGPTAAVAVRLSNTASASSDSSGLRDWNFRSRALFYARSANTWGEASESRFLRMRINGALNASDNADAPTAADGTVTAVKNTPYTFAAADFGFSATAGGDALAYVTILSRPAKGELERNGVALSDGNRVTRAQLDAGSVTYTPVTGDFGSGHASFFFRVTGSSTHSSDDGYLMTVDVSTVPMFPAATVSLSVEENTTAGNVGAAVTATDEDGDTLAYSVAATGETDAAQHLTAFNEDFELDAATGQVTVSSGASIDFEDRPSYKVLVQASDSSGGADGTATLTITVTDVEEPGTAAISGTLAVGQALEARVSDLDGGVSVQSWQWSRSPRPDSGFDDIDSATGSSYTITDADKDFFLRVSMSYTDRRGSGKPASATTGLPVGVTASTLVKNTGQGDTGAGLAGSVSRGFQAFTTGGNPAGYALSSVDLWLAGDAIDSVAIVAKNPGNSNPGSLLLELANPDSMTTDAVNTFTAPAWTLLDPDTTYFIRVDSGGSSFSYAYTASADEDSGAASGWDIANSLLVPRGSSFRTLAGRSLRIDIEGFALLGAPGPPASLTAAAGQGSVALSWSEPGATGRRPVEKYQVRHKETSGSFGVWADVADSDSDSDLSDELSVTVSSLTAGTEYVFEVRAVNARGEGTAADATAIPTVQLNRQPAFPSATASLSAEENSTAGNVGAAITATDEDLDALAYSVAATTDTDAATHLTAFNRDFELDAASGQVTVKGGASIDFEGHPSYKVLVQVSDGKDSSFGTDPAVDAETTLTITVTDVEEPGTVAVSGTLSVGEDLSVVVSDPDGSVSGESWQWSRSPRPDSGFDDIGSADSTPYTTVDADKDFFLRASASYSDRRGSGKSASGTTELPVGVTASTLVKNTGQGSTGSATASGTRVYQAFTTGDNPAGYVLSSVDLWLADDVIRVEIEQNPQDTEPVSVAELANPDSMTPNAANTFTAPAGTVLAPDTTYFLRVFGSEFGNFDYAHTTSADEDSGEASGWSIADEVVGYNLSIFTTTQGRSLRIDIEGFALLGAPGPPASLAAAAGGGSVELSWTEPGSTGRRPVTKYQVHHRETGDSFGEWADVADSDSDNDLSDELSVTVSGLSAGTRYVFEVRAVNARGDGTAARVPATPTTPTVPVFSAADYPGDAAARTVAENTTSGNVGLPIIATDADGDSLTYSVAATGDSDATDHLADFNRDFELDTASGQVSVKAGASIDYETRAAYRVMYQVTDGEDAAGTAERTPVIDDTVTLTVSVTNVDEAGAVTLSGTAQVGEVLTASVSDPDVVSGTPVWRWSKASTMSGSFTDISGAMSASYTVLAADEGEFLRAAATYTDGFGAGRSASATSAVVAAAAATVPVFAAADYPGGAASRSVAENTSSGDVGLPIIATDADGDSLTYSVAATGDTDATDHLADFNRDFELNTATGQISVKSTASIDFEDRSSYVVSYQVTDGEDAAGTAERTPVIDDTVELTITVTNVNERGTVTISGTPKVGETLTASVTDPDGPVSAELWFWSSSATSTGPFVAIFHARSVSYMPVAADVGRYLGVDVTYNVGLEIGDAFARTGAVAAAAASNRAPVFPSAAVSRSVAENTSSGDVGAAVTATDADRDTLVYSVAATGDGDAAAHLAAFNEDFELDSASGQVSVKSGGSIDFEDRSSYKVAVGVSDNKDSSGGADPAVDATTTLTVTVTNVDDAGSVSFSAAGVVGTALTATLTDPDTVSGTATWQWARSGRPDSGFMDLTGRTGASYTPVADDVGYFLRATASYDDMLGSGRTAAGVTAAPVGVPSDRTAVKNTRQRLTTAGALPDKPLYQGFRTGDNPGGYGLLNIAVRMGGWASNTRSVQLWERTGAQGLGSHLVDLEIPSSGEGGFFFAAPPGTVLRPDTTYFLRINGVGTAELVSVFAEDAGAASGWSIDDVLYSGGVDLALTISGGTRVVFSLVVRAFDLLGPPGPVATFTATPGEGSVALSWSAPGSTGHRAVTKYQVRHKETSEADFGAWADVADSDSDTDLSDELSVTVSGLTGGTDYTFEVRAVNARGDGTAARVPATPTAVSNTAPAFSATTEARSVVENTTSGDVGAAVTATDADRDTLAYSVAATGDTDAATHLTAFNADFELDTASGQVSVKSGGSIDYEGRTSYKVSVQVSDNKDSTGGADPSVDATTTLTVTVTDVEEAGTATISGTLSVGEALTASVADPDVDTPSETWAWSRSPRPDTGFTSVGTSSAMYTTVDDDDAFFLRASVDYSDRHGPGKSASATTELPVGVTAATQVKNTGQGSTGTDDNGNSPLFQGFTTGDNPAGYVLSSVGLRLSGTDIGAVELYAKHSSNSNPGSRLAGLEDPDSKTANAVNTFTAPAGTVLEPNTTYFVAVSRRSGATVVPYAYTASDSEDSGAASGWSIASNALSFSSPNYFALGNQILRIDIRGFDLLGPPGPVATFTATPGEGSAALSWTAPASTGRRPVTKYQVRHKETSEADFGVWTDVADSNSDNDLSDELSVTVSGLTGGTDYTFEVRAVNTRGDGTETDATATPTAVSVTSTRELVSNIGQGERNFWRITRDVGQGFTTGYRLSGYTVSDIAINSQDPQGDAVSAKICEVNSSDVPTAVCTDLTPPRSFASGNLVFTAPTNPALTLATSTSYILVMDRAGSGGVRLGNTASGELDSSGLRDWGIRSKAQFSDSGGRWSDASGSRLFLIRINGSVNASATVGAPTAADGTVTAVKNMPYTFTADDFGFSATAGGDALASVSVLSLPAMGELGLDGVAVTAGDSVTRTQLDGGDLTYTPVADRFGSDQARFFFRVTGSTHASDDGYLMTVDVLQDLSDNKPSVRGSAYLGEALTVDNSDVDPAGVPGGLGTLTYQWIRVDDDGESNPTDIGDGSGRYVLTDEDVGKRIKVTAGFTDSMGDPVSLTSDAFPAEGTVQRIDIFRVPLTWSGAPQSSGQPVFGIGDRYRLLVVTQTDLITGVTDSDNKKDAASYNGKVAERVGTNSVLAPYKDGFSALVSTTGDSSANPAVPAAVARDNTKMTGTGGVPIYWFTGAKVADDYPDFYDGDWDSRDPKNEGGAAISRGNHIWTGSLSDGTPSDHPLGSSDSITYGRTGQTGEEINKGSLAQSAGAGLYAVSAIFRVNSPPVAANGSVSTPEDTAYVFSAEDFGFSDTVDESDVLESVKITGLPAQGKGTLVLGDSTTTPAELPATVAGADLAGGLFTYTPPADESGDGFASFTFKVNDGVEDSAAEYTMTIDVTAVDDPGAVTFAGTPQAGEELTARVSDPDGSVSDDVWVWSKSQTRSGTFTDIAGADSESYTPTPDDVGMFLRAAATYDDGSGSGRTASAHRERGHRRSGGGCRGDGAGVRGG